MKWRKPREGARPKKASPSKASSRPPSKVLIDARMVGPVLHGVARYVSLIARGLSAMDCERRLPYRPVFVVGRQWAQQSRDFYGFEQVVASSPYLSPLELLELPWLVRKARASIYHSPSFSSLLYCPVPWISTIHDLNHLQYGGLREGIYYGQVLRRFALGASQLATVSKFSRRELAHWLSKAESQIETVYNALDPAIADPPSDAEVSEVLDRFGLRRGGYFFCLSNSKPHKNVRLLVHAYEQYARDPGSRLPLVLSLTADQLEAPAAGVLPLGSLKEAEARALLAGARSLFFPSLYEGFGLPPIEAVAMGVPVTVSRIPAHEEALMDLLAEEARWVSPHDISDWARAFSEAERSVRPISSESRARLKRRYDYRRLGQDMDRIYRLVLDRSKV